MTGMPSVDTKSIGAGGGSIAWIDEGGLLHVGPISAGAVPGPVAYGRGGSRPTVTDAAVVLGYIDPAHFLGGRMPLDRKAAEAAIATRDRRSNRAEPRRRRGCIDPRTCQRAHGAGDPGRHTQSGDRSERRPIFVAGGGAAGLNCVAIGRRLGCGPSIVPETGAALAAAGALISDLTSHHQAMRHTTSKSFDFDGVN